MSTNGFTDTDAISRSTDLHALEQIIQRGRATFIEVGAALLRIREGRLYMATHNNWDVYCRDRWGWGRNYANKLAVASEVAVDLAAQGTVVPTERAARELVRVATPEERTAIVEEAREIREASGKEGPPTAADLHEAIERKRTHPAAGSSRSDDSDERYTPAEWVELAREVMGGIDLDPASCAAANEIVEATTFFDLEANGLEREWLGRVWNNWPFSAGNMPRFAAKLFEEIDAKRVEQAIVLTNADTGAGWFQDLGGRADSTCFPKGRINFIDAPRGNWLSQAFFYFGRRVRRFEQIFGRRGLVGKLL